MRLNACSTPPHPSLSCQACFACVDAIIGGKGEILFKDFPCAWYIYLVPSVSLRIHLKRNTTRELWARVLCDSAFRRVQVATSFCGRQEAFWNRLKLTVRFDAAWTMIYALESLCQSAASKRNLQIIVCLILYRIFSFLHDSKGDPW